MFKYKSKSKETLIRRIRELEETIVLLDKINQKEELVSYPYVENLGHWVFMNESNEVFFNNKKLISLGYDPENLPLSVSYDFFMDKIHPEDYMNVMNNMKRHFSNETIEYEIEYRIQNLNGEYIWHYDRGAVTKRDEEGNPIVIAGVSFDTSEKRRRELALEKTNEKLKVLVNTDVLTPAFNKRYLSDALNQLIESYAEHSEPFSLVMMDIDDFKIMNDTFGHLVGDEVLKSVVKAAVKSLKPTDIIARWGGDEFMILLPETNLEQAIELSKQILDSINEINFDKIETVKASVGIHAYSTGDTILETVDKVDQMMYKSKQTQKNGLVYELGLV